MSRGGGRAAAAAALTLGLAAIVAGVAIAPAALERWAVGTSSRSLAWGPWLFKALLVWHGALCLWLASVMARQHTASVSRTPDAPQRTRAAPIYSAGMTAMIAGAAAIRLYRLDTGLWLDEIRTLVDFIRQPFHLIVSSFPSQNQHPFYSVLAHVSVLALGESAASVRLPAALFGVASIWALWRLGRLVTTPRQAFLACLLLTVSYHHVWFSQNARGYTGLLFFTTLSTYLWLEASDRKSLGCWVTYAGVAAFGLWTHATMALVLVGQGLVFLLTARQGWRQGGSAAWSPFGALLLGGSLALQLHALALPEFFGVALHEASAGAEWTTPAWAIRELVARLGDGGVTAAAAVAALAVLLAGVWDLSRRDWRVGVLFVAPPFVGAVTMLALAHDLWPRFFFFAAGFILLALVRGVFVGTLMLARTAGRLRLVRVGPSAAVTAATVACITASVLSAATLPRSYLPKQDFAGARDYVQSRLGDRDVVVTTGLAAEAYTRYYAPPWPVVSTAAELENVRGYSQAVWVVYTLPIQLQTYHADLWAAIERNCREVAAFTGTLGGGAVHVCVVDRDRAPDGSRPAGSPAGW
jgi:hypothetical protein